MQKNYILYTYNYNKFLESNFYIRLDSDDIIVNGEISNFEPWNSEENKNKMRFFANKFEKRAHDVDAEHLAASLFGAELEPRDAAFRDLQVFNPIPGLSYPNEFISVKSSKTMNTLKTAINNTNGFKLNSLILFMMEKLNPQIFLKPRFIKRHEMDIKNLFNMYKSIILRLYFKDIKSYIIAFNSIILVLKIVKEFFTRLFEVENKVLEGKKIIEHVITMAIVSYMDEVKGWQEFKNIRQMLTVSRVEELQFEETLKLFQTFSDKYKKESQNAYSENGYDAIGDGFLDKFSEIKLSYCIIYFEKPHKNEETIKIYKTQALSCAELFKNTTRIWTNNKNYQKTIVQGKVNIYLTYDLILQAFEGNGLTGKDVFETEITIKVPHSWSLKHNDDLEFENRLRLFNYRLWDLKRECNKEKAKEFVKLNPSLDFIFR